MAPEITNENATAVDLLSFIDASPTPYHAVGEARRRLEAGGFVRLAETDEWPDGAGSFVVVRGGSLVAWRQEATVPAAFRVIGAHTDSPNLRIKPRPDMGAAGYRQLGVEVYGGVLLNSWLDRDLGLAGRVVADAGAGGGLVEHVVRLDDTVLRIPQLAIHLDRQITAEGLKLDPQKHLVPIWGLGEPDEGDLARRLAMVLGVPDDAVRAWDLMGFDLEPGRLAGDGELVSAPRIDNLASCHAATLALLDTQGGEALPMICLFDHEEVGSDSAVGAGGPFLESTMIRIVDRLGGTGSQRARAIAASLCLSVDGAHATNPNYVDRHEPSHQIRLNGGPVLKMNANQRYATDASGAAAVTAAADRVGVPLQRFVNRTDLPCGSTIGPITATRLGMTTVDLGLPQLAMHSIREMCGAEDPLHLFRLLTAALDSSPLPVSD